MRGLFIDPGTTQSGYVIYDGIKIYESGVLPNEKIEAILEQKSFFDYVGIEQIEGRGNVLGKETFETLIWSGVFKHAAKPKSVFFAPPAHVRAFLTGRPNVSDKQVTEALLKRYRDKFKVWNERSNPDLADHHLLTSHSIQAFALAAYLIDSPKSPLKELTLFA